jgi:SCY1-like protein 1
MLKSFEFGGGGTKVFNLILTIAEKLSDDDFEKDIQPVVVRMFASQERGVRMCLLENLGRIVEKLQERIVNEKVFPNMVGNHFILRILFEIRVFAFVFVGCLFIGATFQ